MLRCHALLCAVMSSRCLSGAAGPPGFHTGISLTHFFATLRLERIGAQSIQKLQWISEADNLHFALEN